jgi:hypothetical protein
MPIRRLILVPIFGPRDPGRYPTPHGDGHFVAVTRLFQNVSTSGFAR